LPVAAQAAARELGRECGWSSAALPWAEKPDGVIDLGPQRQGRNRRGEFEDAPHPRPGDHRPRNILCEVPVMQSIEHADPRHTAEAQLAQINDDLLVTPREPGQLRPEPVGIEGIDFSVGAKDHDALIPQNYQPQACGVGRY